MHICSSRLGLFKLNLNGFPNVLREESKGKKIHCQRNWLGIQRGLNKLLQFLKKCCHLPFSSHSMCYCFPGHLSQKKFSGLSTVISRKSSTVNFYDTVNVAEKDGEWESTYMWHFRPGWLLWVDALKKTAPPSLEAITIKKYDSNFF